MENCQWHMVNTSSRNSYLHCSVLSHSNRDAVVPTWVLMHVSRLLMMLRIFLLCLFIIWVICFLGEVTFQTFTPLDALSSYCWVSRVLYVIWIQFICQINDVQIFSPIQLLVFSFCKFFTEQKVFNFHQVQFIIFFSFCGLCFWCHL